MQNTFDDRWSQSPDDPNRFASLLADLASTPRGLALKALVPDETRQGSSTWRSADGPVGWTDEQRAAILDTWLQRTPVATMDEALRNELRTLLMHGALNGRLPQVRVLREHGIDLVAVDEITFSMPNGFGYDTMKDTGWTLMHLAAYKAQAAVVDFLVAQGDPVDVVSTGGLTVLHTLVLAMDEDEPQVPKGWRAVADRLLDAGADRLVPLNAKLLHNQTVLDLVDLLNVHKDWDPAWERIQLIRAADATAPAPLPEARAARARL